MGITGRRLLVAAGAIAAALGWGELVHRRSAGRALPARSPSGGSQVVVVLGFRNRSPRANAVNRLRAGVGVRTLDPAATRRRMVVCGGAVAGERSEASLIAEHLRQSTDERTAPYELVLEERSASTWQNVLNATPHLEGFDRIAIASDSLHAEKARRYLYWMRPDLAAHLVRGRDHRFGELTLLKPVNAIRGLVGLRRARRDLDRMDRVAGATGS